MKKLLVFSVVIFALVSAASPGENKQYEPSFDEFSDWNHRHPGEDINVDLYKRHWRDSHIHTGHGGFVEQEVLFPGDPLNPSKPGAVLKFIKAYNHGILNAGCYTQPVMHEKEQVFFYVLQGTGRVETGVKKADISEGSGVFVPAKLEYRFFNTSGKPLDVLIYSRGNHGWFQTFNRNNRGELSR